jgi:hypothetical protein
VERILVAGILKGKRGEREERAFSKKKKRGAMVEVINGLDVSKE